MAQRAPQQIDWTHANAYQYNNGSGGLNNPNVAAFKSLNVPQQLGGRPSQSSIGTQISANGVVTIRTIVPDLEDAFLAVRDTSRFLHALFGEWSTPALKNGRPFEPGATYRMEHFETRQIEDLNSTEKSATIRRIKNITIKEIVDEPAYKIFNYEVDSKFESSFFSEPFAPTTYMSVEIGPFPYGPQETLLTLTMDGGPPDVETTYCCLCIANPGSMQSQQDSQEARPKVYAQSNSFVEYVKSYDPNSSLAQQVNMSRTPMRRKISQQSSKSGGMMSNASPYAMRTGPTSPYGNSKNGSAPPSPMFRSPGGSFNGSNGGVRAPLGSPPAPPGAGMMHQGSAISSASTGSADEIRKLFELYTAGALTKEEFEFEKRKIVGLKNPPRF